MIDTVKLLVIDDSEDDRLLYRRSLRKSTGCEYTIGEADNGDDGLKQIDEDPPACILLDYSLPGRDGVEVLKRIRARHPFIPIVMMTGQGNEKVAVTAMQEGAQNYISKSAVTTETLERVLHAAIEHCSMQKRIHEQRASLEIFTRALAHDLKEPVRTIRSFLDLITAHEPLSEHGRNYFHYIRSAAERMNTLIDTVYFYTRLDGAPTQIARETCDMAETLEAAKDNIGELIRSRGAVITNDPLPQVEANRMQVIQVLQNLLCNAVRHCETSPVIHIQVSEGEEQWLFRVSDNGPGIAAENAKKIFQPFKRLTRQSEQGLGLGLAICQKIIESHGGKIWYESSAEAGATFMFTLPKTQAAATPAAATSLAANGVHVNNLANILLVEDNDADVELTRIMLIEQAHLQCNLLIANSGHQALAALHNGAQSNSQVDLILLDINMPGMDGFELLERMRKDDALRNVPVVICSTSSYDKDMEKAKTLGAAGYLTKPAEFTKLKSVIDTTAGIKLHRQGNGYMLMRAA